jgi:hypothetical protein
LVKNNNPQNLSGGASRRHSSFGFLGKTYIAIAIALATLIIKISLFKARRWRAFNKLILVFPAPSALETLKSISTIKL